jgi:glucose/arabinose dehydrogenase
MSRFSRRSQLLASLFLIVASCSDDKDDPNAMPAPGGGSGGTGAQTGSGGTVGAGGANGGASGAGDVDLPGNLPLEPGTGGTDGSSAGSGGAPSEPPPTGALAPNCDAPEGTLPGLQLTQVAGGLTNPLFLTVAPGDNTRLFVIEQIGRIRIIENGQLVETPFIDLTGQITAGGERGLLGLAFHPDYQNNGLFYVHYSANAAANTPTGNGTAVIAEFAVSADDPGVANPDSERRLLTQQDAEANHNGGMLEFGPDGLLYAAFGDGGGADDNDAQHDPAIGNGQSLNTLFGKILRLDVAGRDAGALSAYGIPPGNMTGANVRPEIWSYGWRNPWRYSFDRCGGDLYIGDVGQNTLEEIDFEPAGSTSGRNYGWRLMEAGNCFNPAQNCNPNNNLPLVLPVTSYGRMVGQSITGGYVYRGSAIPGLRGTYLYADYASARFFSLRIENGAAVGQQEITDDINPLADLDNNPNTALERVGGIASFGMDNAGEMYVLSQGEDAVYRIDPQP